MARSRLPSVLVAGVHWPPETFLSQLFRGLAAVGHEVGLVTSHPLRHRSETETRHGRIQVFAGMSMRAAPHTALARGSNLLLRSTLAWPAAKRGAWREMRSSGATLSRAARTRVLAALSRRWDVVYFPWNSSAETYGFLRGTGLPRVVSCRGSQVNVAVHDPGRPHWRAMLTDTLSEATAVHCVSEHLAGGVRALGVAPSRVQVIRPGVDTVAIRPRTRLVRDGPFDVHGVGSLNWRKGQEYALMAIRRLKDRGHDVRLTWYGSGPDRQRILYTAADLGIADRVRLLGHRPQAEILQGYQRAHAFLLSSVTEGISNAALEAMAAGVPVISTDCGGMSEAIDHDVSGLLVPPRNSDAMADAIERLAADPALADRLAHQARRTTEAWFSFDPHVAAFSDLFRAVARGEA